MRASSLNSVSSRHLSGNPDDQSDRNPSAWGGNLVFPETGVAGTEEFAGRLRAKKVDAINRLTAPMMAVNLVNIAAFLFVLARDGQLSQLVLIWAAAVASVSLWSLLRYLAKRHRPPPVTTSVRTIRRVIVNAGLFGLLWAVPGATFFPALSGFSLAFGAAVLTGMISGGAFALYPVPAAAMAFMLPIVLSAVSGVAMVFGALALGLVLIAAMFIMVFQRVIRRHADLFDSEFRGRLELERRNILIQDLLEDARLEALGSQRLSEQRLAQAKKMEAIGQLTGGIAHDFNNLLTAVRGNAELLAHDGGCDPSLVNAILQSSDRGARQVQRLLSVAQEQKLRPEPVNLPALLADIQRVLEPTLGPGLRLHWHVASGARAPFVDPAHLENALINLVFNARDAMRQSGVTRISCRDAPGEPGAAPAVQICVTDDGIGMDDETRERALDPFFTTKKFGQGSGLGLSSVAGFARQSGGDIALSSAPNAGTRVTLRLPAARPAGGQSCPDMRDDAAPPARRTILVVEDMPEVLAVTRQILERLGYRVLSARDAEQAMAQLDGAAAPDLVLTDILLSRSMTGLQLAKQIRRRTDTVPVIFMSALSLSEVRTQGEFSGKLLQKPFSREQLAAHVAHALETANLNVRA